MEKRPILEQKNMHFVRVLNRTEAQAGNTPTEISANKTHERFCLDF